MDKTKTLMIGAEPNLEVMPAIHPVIGDIFISGLMFYPEKEKIESRRRYSFAALSEYLDIMEKNLQSNEFNEKDWQTMVDWQNSLFNTLLMNSGGHQTLYKLMWKYRLNEGASELESRRRHGSYIGYIFDFALRNKMSGNEVALETEKFISGLESEGKNTYTEKMWANEDSFRANVWNKFVNVAHLWAALNLFKTPTTYGAIPVIQFNNLKLASGEDCESPLLTFLNISDDYLKNAQTKSKSKPLINKNKAIRLSLFFDPE